MRTISKEAIRRKSGARGLRSIMENIMLDIMYDLPSHPEIQECIINEEVLTKNASLCSCTGARTRNRPDTSIKGMAGRVAEYSHPICPLAAST